jgi:hypothetical protein
MTLEVTVGDNGQSLEERGYEPNLLFEMAK